MNKLSMLVFFSILFHPAISLSQINRWPPTLEIITSCDPAFQDSNAALYRHKLEGYSDQVSVAQGDSIDLHISCSDSIHLSGMIDTIKIFRYEETGWVYLATVGAHTVSYHPFHYLNGDVIDYKEGAQWSHTASVYISPSWKSGFYCAGLKARGRDSVFYTGAIPFVVKENDPASTSSILWIVPTNTYQAYNSWGGSSLYWNSDTLPALYRTDTVSFDRPYNAAIHGKPVMDSMGQFHEREWAWVQWMEREGYPVEFCTDYDLDQNIENFISNY